MPDVVITGIGQTPVGENWNLSLANLAAKAILAARKDAGGPVPQAMYIGNMLAATISHQANLGALLAEDLGLTGIEACTVDAAGASGAAALRLAYLAVSAGMIDTALVVGVEKFTDYAGPGEMAGPAQMMDNDYEAAHGVTPTSQAGLLMQRYMHDYHVPHSAFAGFTLNAHANAANNPHAMFRKPLTQEAYDRAEMISDPVSVMDMGAYADGAAAVILTRSDLLPENPAHRPVRITGSSIVTDTLALHDRQDPLAWYAAAFSVERACRQAGILPTDVHLFELFDAFTIYSVLSLEAAGFARRGEGWKLAQDGQIGLRGRLPISTMGGLKGRGNPLGASGVYQVVEAVLQLRGEAGKNQVSGARRALVQSLGGVAATAVTHVLEQ